MTITTRYWPGLLATPACAAAAAGSSRSRQGSRPWRRCAWCSPATTPGTAHAAAPMWNRCEVRSSNGTSTSSTSASGRAGSSPAPGIAVNASISAARPSGRRTSRNPPPQGPVSAGSAAHDMAAAATAASTALPPRSSASAPARAVRSCPAAIAPCMGGLATAGTRAAAADPPAAAPRPAPCSAASPAPAWRSRWPPPSPTSGRRAVRPRTRRR